MKKKSEEIWEGLGLSFDAWREVKLEDITELIIDYRGKTPKKLNSSWSDKGYRAFSAKNIKTGKIVKKDSIRFVDKELYKKWMKDEVNKGDILITSEAPYGQVYYWDSDEKIVLSQRLFGIRTTNNVVDRYVYYYMTSSFFQNELDSRATGTTVKGLRQPELLKCNVSLPSYKEQTAVANILSSLDEKIEVNNQINKTLENMAQELFKRWFLDFEFPNEEGEPYQSSGGEMVESELGMIPKGWKSYELRDFFKFVKGKKPKKIEEFEFPGSLKYLTIDVLSRKSLLYASNEKMIEADKNNVLMVMDGASSGTVYYGQKGIVGSTLAKLELTNNGLSNQFLLVAFKFLENDIKNRLTGSAIPHTDKEYTYRLKISLPDNNRVYKQAHKIFQNFTDQIIIKKEENEKLKNIRDTLLPKLMSGEIRVPLEELEESLTEVKGG